MGKFGAGAGAERGLPGGARPAPSPSGRPTSGSRPASPRLTFGANPNVAGRPSHRSVPPLYICMTRGTSCGAARARAGPPPAPPSCRWGRAWGARRPQPRQGPGPRAGPRRSSGPGASPGTPPARLGPVQPGAASGGPAPGPAQAAVGGRGGERRGAQAAASLLRAHFVLSRSRGSFSAGPGMTVHDGRAAHYPAPIEAPFHSHANSLAESFVSSLYFI